MTKREDGGPALTDIESRCIAILARQPLLTGAVGCPECGYHEVHAPTCSARNHPNPLYGPNALVKGARRSAVAPTAAMGCAAGGATMSYDLTCEHCGEPTPDGVCSCGKAAAAILLRIYRALDEPLACGHDLVNWCEYCETCGECRDAGKGDKTLKAELSRLRAIEKAAQDYAARRCDHIEPGYACTLCVERRRVAADILAGRSSKV